MTPKERNEIIEDIQEEVCGKIGQIIEFLNNEIDEKDKLIIELEDKLSELKGGAK